MVDIETKTIDQVRRDALSSEISLAGIDAPLHTERWRDIEHPLSDMEKHIDALLKLERVVSSFTVEDPPEVVSERLNELYQSVISGFGPLVREFGSCRNIGEIILKLQDNPEITDLKASDIFVQPNVKFAIRYHRAIQSLIGKNRDVHEMYRDDVLLKERIDQILEEYDFEPEDLKKIIVSPICINLILTDSSFERAGYGGEYGFTDENIPFTFVGEGAPGLPSVIFHETVHQFMEQLESRVFGGIGSFLQDYSSLVLLSRRDPDELSRLREVYADIYAFEPDDLDEQIVIDEGEAVIDRLTSVSIFSLLDSLREEMCAELHHVRELGFGDRDRVSLSNFDYFTIYSTASNNFCALYRVLDRIGKDADNLSRWGDRLSAKLRKVGDNVRDEFRDAFVGLRRAFYVAEHLSPSLTEELRMACVITPVPDYKKLVTYVRAKSDDREFVDSLLVVESIRHPERLSFANLSTIISLGDLLNENAKELLRKVISQPLYNYGSLFSGLLDPSEGASARYSDPIEKFRLDSKDKIQEYKSAQEEVAAILGGTVEELFHFSHIIEEDEGSIGG